VRTLLTLVLLVSGLGLAGCGAPDPRDNPNFDQAAYDDVDLSSKALSEDDAVSR